MRGFQDVCTRKLTTSSKDNVGLK